MNDDTAKTGAAVPHLDETFLQLTVGYDDLLLLAEVHAGATAPGDVPGRLREAGLVGPAGLNPTAAGLVEVAVAPARSVVVERFDGSTLSPMFIGWLPDGRATTSAPDAEGAVVVTATEFGLLRDQLRQWLGIFEREVADDRQTLSTDTTVIDAAVSARGVEATGVDALDEVIANWRLAWRANGNWAQRPIDASVTIVDAGTQGWYRVDHPPRHGAEPVDVTLVPLDLDAVLTVLGDVVTGRNTHTDE
ncbi:hypothetical protein AFL01nite_11290 [Aeromicrobium flavum]|uniref:ESX secretion-associated protein EspG n=1 Tax=Aeromicrobium flavum TaxID=416568 RepID=A0A512HTL4_9ACTN|nr:hypothetical protein [Aeromicrobium flavum]GEO88802.1 hypothetical protein AFL01nite_11290 [Aeromicrobium flavum]